MTVQDNRKPETETITAAHDIILNEEAPELAIGDAVAITVSSWEGGEREIKGEVADLCGQGPSPDGINWRDTIEMRNPILRRSGALARSIDYRASADSLVVGSGLVYAAIHQFGGVIRPKTASALAFMLGGRLVVTQKVTMPARPYLGLSPQNRAEATRSVVAYLRRMLG